MLTWLANKKLDRLRSAPRREVYVVRDPEKLRGVAARRGV